MIPESANLNLKTVSSSLPFATTQRLTALPLGNESLAETLWFLALRPLHTVVMVGLIIDNGLVSELNRGTFYGYRNDTGALEGVALIGHTTLVEVRSDAALSAFARVAQGFGRAHVIVGEQEQLTRFWNYYSTEGQPLRRLCRESLWELNRIPPKPAGVHNLTLATAKDLSLVVPVHAAMALDESGVDPLRVDPDGFRERCLRRIEQGRVWLATEDDRLIFKADVISDTPDVIYLEGIYVRSENRGQGFGSRCLAELSRHLLSRTKSITVLVNNERPRARGFFQKLGFAPRAVYDTIYLRMQRDLS